MTWKITAILALLITSGVGLAQAETSTVEVPFESHGQSCWLDDLALEYTCTWQGVVEKFTIEDLKEFKDVLSNERYDQEIERLNQEALEKIAIEKAKLTPDEKIILEIEQKLNKGIATATDSVLMNMLKELNTCKQGMDNRTVHIQTAREFEISDFKLWSVNNIKYDGRLGDIAKSIEECKSQTYVFKASVGYQNMITGEDDIQYSLHQKYTRDVQAVNYDKLHATNNAVNSSLICDSNQHSKQYKKQFGCVILYDGLEYKSEILTDYMKFMNTYGGREATVEDKKAQEEIAIPIANEWKEDHLFYNNNLED